MEGNQADLLEHVYTDSEKEFLLRIIKTKIAPILEALARGGSAWAWEQWMMEVRRQRAVEAAIKLREDVVEVMKNSTRGNRTQEERDLIHQYVSKNLSCIPDDTSHQAMDMLCNEIDYYQAVDSKSIMFLQGDFGNCYYMIGDGKVDLYLVQGKDKEMDMGREYGALRGIPYEGKNFAEEVLKEDLEKTKTSLLATISNDDEGERQLGPKVAAEEEVSPVGTNSAIGKKIVTLEKGRGFGEFAILSTAGKIRMCSAVAATSNTFCFILHSSTYNAVLKQHHYRSSKLSAATALLATMPVFNTYSAAKLGNIAYNMTATMHQKTSLIARAGTEIKRVMVVHTGTVRVVQERGVQVEKEEGSDGDDDDEEEEEEDEEEEPTMTETLLKRLPRLAVSVLGKGSIIGETEILQGQSRFKMTYISNSSDCEVFEMPVNLYKECCMEETVSEHQADLMLEKLTLAKKRDARTCARLDRADERIKKMALERAKLQDDKATLLRMLPVLIDGVTMEGAAGLENMDPATGSKRNGDYFRHRDSTAQEIVDKNKGSVVRRDVDDGFHEGYDRDRPFGFDPSSSGFLEDALGRLPGSPGSTGSPEGGLRSPFSPARVRLGSRMASRASTGQPPSPGSPRHNTHSSTPTIRRDGGSPVGNALLSSPLTGMDMGMSMGMGATEMLSSPAGAPRSRPSPRHTRVLSASSYRD